MSAAGRDDDRDDLLDVSAVRRLRVPELRARLKARGLDSTGLKGMLVDRLWGAMQADRGGAEEGKGGGDAQAGSGAGPSGVAVGRKSATDEKMARFAEGQYETGQNCLSGENGEEQDEEKGVELLKAAAHGGHAKAQVEVGRWYYHGRHGLARDFVKAVKWWRKAADQGDAGGQWRLGGCYQDGEGVDKDEVEGARLFRLSAEQGNADGQCELGYCYYDGSGVDQDFEEAVKWYRLAVEQGDADAQYNLGLCYRYGRGVEQNYEKTAQLYELAAHQDHEDSQKYLGLLYFEGNGVQRNCDTALTLLRRSGSDAEDATDAIAEIERSAQKLVKKRTETQLTMIEAGESVFGQAQDGTGDFALHVAARALQADTVALFFDHPSFDDLVLRANTAGELPRDVVSERRPAKAQSRDARALRSILSVSRRSRAACVLWCFEVLRDIAAERLMACIPRDIVREVVQYVLPPAPPGSLSCEVSTLLVSPFAWTRPCLAIAPQLVPQPTSPQDVIAMQQQEHGDLAHAAQGTGTKSERGTKRVLEEQDDEATSGCEDDDATQSEMDVVEPASKRLRS